MYDECRGQLISSYDRTNKLELELVVSRDDRRNSEDSEALFIGVIEVMPGETWRGLDRSQKCWVQVDVGRRKGISRLQTRILSSRIDISWTTSGKVSSHQTLNQSANKTETTMWESLKPKP